MKDTLSVIDGEIVTEPFPAIAERDPLATFIFWLPAHGLYDTNNCENPIM